MIKVYFLLVCILLARIVTFFLAPPRYSQGEKVTLETVLDREPEVVSGHQVIHAGDLTVYVPIVPELHFGDRVRLAGTVQKGFISRPTVEIIGRDEGSIWTRSAVAIRDQFSRTYQNLFSTNEANLLSGIVLGNIGLDRSFKDKLANVGLTHVVAASGMNISLFSGFIVWLLSGLRFRKIIKVIIIIILILFYSSVTGFEPSIVRAAIMAVSSLVGAVIGRQKSGFWLLALSAYLMLWVNPNLILSASFLLSFSSMAGQIFLSSLKLQLTNSSGLVMVFWDFVAKDFLQSFSSILFTVPIVLAFFSRFSLVSILTNTLVLWTVEPLMILGAVIGLTGAQFLALPTSVLLSFFLFIVESFGKLGLVLQTSVNWPIILGYYLLLGGVIYYKR